MKCPRCGAGEMMRFVNTCGDNMIQFRCHSVFQDVRTDRGVQSVECARAEGRWQGHMEAVEAVRTMSPEHGAYSFDDNSYTLTGYHYVKPETLRRRLARMRSKK